VVEVFAFDSQQNLFFGLDLFAEGFQENKL